MHNKTASPTNKSTCPGHRDLPAPGVVTLGGYICPVGTVFHTIVVHDQWVSQLEAQGPCTGHRSIIAILHCFSVNEKYTI